MSEKLGTRGNGGARGREWRDEKSVGRRGVGEPISPTETKRESRAADTFPFMGLQGQVLIFVIPAKAGIRTAEAKFAARNQV